MNRRDEYLRALRGEPTDSLTWAPNFDQWYGVNSAAGTVPEPYRELSRNDLVRAVGGVIWRRVSLVKSDFDASVSIDSERQDRRRLTRYRTPAGELTTVHQQSTDSSQTWYLVEHAVKSVDDLRPLRYLIDATRYRLDVEGYRKQAAEVGADGIVLTCLPSVPFIHFAKIDVGYEHAYFLLQDHPKQVHAVLDAYQRKFLQAYRLAAEGPCEIISNGDNMDQLTCPPDYFARYAVPYYQEVRRILHAAGKLAQGHWCGKLDRLIPLVPGCGLDIIEAVTPKPMSDLDMAETMAALEGKTVVQGGIPAVYMCDVGCTRDALAAYIERLLQQVGHCRGFVLGMGDNVPSNADFARVKMVSDLVALYNRNRPPAAEND